jgi:hypothetical protein
VLAAIDGAGDRPAEPPEPLGTLATGERPAVTHTTEELAQADIDIHHLYATASASQTQCLLVFATANNDRAMVLLNASAGAAVTERA